MPGKAKGKAKPKGGGGAGGGAEKGELDLRTGLETRMDTMVLGGYVTLEQGMEGVDGQWYCVSHSAA